jgi:hypothetical protein
MSLKWILQQAESVQPKLICWYWLKLVETDALLVHDRGNAYMLLVHSGTKHSIHNTSETKLYSPIITEKEKEAPQVWEFTKSQYHGHPTGVPTTSTVPPTLI